MILVKTEKLSPNIPLGSLINTAWKIPLDRLTVYIDPSTHGTLKRESMKW